MKKIYLFILSLILITAAQAQLTGIKNIPGDYATLAAAITDLNTQGVGVGGVTLNVVAGNPQTSPANLLTTGGGYIIGGTGSVVLTTTSAANPVIIQGNGNTVTAPATHVVGQLNDGIFKLIGADWITITGFTIQENAANTVTAAATNNMTEWGVALLYVTTTNGCQNITIQNCTIDLNRTYTNTIGIYSNSTHSTTAPTTSATATTATGGNHNLVITGNTVTDVNQGIVVVGPTAAADQNIGLVIGGSLPNANTLTNYGTAAAVSTFANVSGTVNGILVRNSIGFTISHNSITSSAGGVNAAATTLRGIYNVSAGATPTGTFTNTINNNTIALTHGFTSGTIQGITVEATNATATSSQNINNNNFTALTSSVVTSGAITAITTVAIHLNNSINNNTFTNITTNTTGSVTFISQSYTATATATKTVNNNAIVTGFTKTGAGGTVTFALDNGSSVAGAVSTYQNNSIINGTLTGATAFIGISCTDGGTSPTKNITGNSINNWTTGAAAMTGINVTYLSGSSSISTNTITNLNGQGAISGINIGSTASGTSLDISSNIINNLISTGTGGAVSGIASSNATTTINITGHTIFGLSSTGASAVSGISISGAATTNVFKNKIYNISGSNALSTVNGIAVSAGTTINVYNNLIGALTTPAANAANPLNGLNITGGTTVNAYFNTINLAASSSGALFGSSAISASTTPALTLRNNIFVNSSSVTGAGLAVAYRRSSATLTSYDAASNKNLFSATTIYTDGITPQATLAAYQALVTPRDANSINETPNFLSTNGPDATFLHINTTIATAIENGADPISGISDDFDGDIRNVATPDIGADEFTVVVVSCTGQPAAGSITPTSASRCIGQTYSMSATGLTTGTGISYQWQVGTASGGPYSNVTGGTGATTSSYTTGALATGVYYYVLQTTCSTSGQTNITNEVVVTVNALPTVAVTPTSVTICQPGAIAVPLTASGATTYTWSPTTGLTPSTGANVSALPTATTTYTVTGTDGNGCINTATSVITVNGAPIITSVTATPNPVCSGGSTQLQVNVSNSVVKITEVMLNRGGTGTTVTYPFASFSGADLIEISNISAASVDISGYTIADYASATGTVTHPVLTFPVGTIIPANSVVVVCLGTGTDDIPNRYFNTGGSSDFWLSSALVGIVLKNGANIVDAVGCGSGYAFNVGTGVTATDWSGFAPSASGLAGTIRNAALDNNTGGDWIGSSAGTPQTIGTYNGGYTAPSGTVTYSWTPTTGLSDPTIANPVASNITANTTYNVSVINGSCTSTGSVAVTLATYNSSVITQPSIAAVTAGSVDNQVILMTIPQACTAETLTQFDFTNASTVLSDVSNAKVYYNTTNNFATATVFGTTAVPTATFTVTGSQALSTTTSNFFWLVFDVACNAGNTNAIDAGLTSFTVGASTYSPTPSNPTGTRTITGLASLFTTTQPSSATVTNGSVNQQIVRISVPATGCGPLTNITFNTNGSTNAATDIAAARVYYTTSTTFSATTQFGTDALLPNGSFTITGSQALSSTLTNYFWLVYDVSCNATPANVLDAEVNNVTIAGNVYTPATVNPAGTRAITALYVPTRTDGNSTTAIQLGTQNAQFVYALISGSSVCPGTVTDVNFTVTNPNPTDVVNAKCYYTTTSTFSTANPFGTFIANPTTGAQTFTGSQLLATGNNYFWVVYDISCTGPAGASVNADINSLVVSGNTIPVTGTATAANTLTAITSFTTVADGEWSNTATWACGNVPPTNATAVTIAHNITVSNTGNIGGSVTINSGKSLTINTGGELTLGTIGGDNRTLTNSGTLAVTGGNLNINGNLLIASGSTFNQSGGDITIDPNSGVVGTSVAAGTATMLINSNLGTVTAGTIKIVDPNFNSTGKALDYSVSTNSLSWATGHTLIIGDPASANPSANTSGFILEQYTSTGKLALGNLVIDGGAGVNKQASLGSWSTFVNGNLTVNANSFFTIAAASTGAVIAGNVTNNGTITQSATTGLILAATTGTTTVVNPNPQTIGGAGVYRNLAASPTAELNTLTINNSSVAGVTIATPLRISGTLTLTAGIVNTTLTNILTVGYNATNVGTLNFTSGRVNGPLKRWISAVIGARAFPVGNATFSKNASINFTTAPTTAGTLTAMFSSTAPSFPNASPLTEGALLVNTVSKQGSWFVDAADGLAGGTYTATFTGTGANDIADFTKTVLVKRPSAGGDWTLDGVHITTTGSNSAPVLSRSAVTGFSEFAIGGENNVVLPVTIEFFKGAKIAGANYLDWKITCTSAPTVTLSLERSADGRSFIAIQDQNATAARCLQGFNYTDVSPLSGANYYRLKITTPDGQFRYSTIVVLLNKQKGFELISLAPNPVINSAMLTLTSAKSGKIEIAVSDIGGKIVALHNVTVIAGNNPIDMNFINLGAGTYSITAINADGERKTIRFVKY